MIKKLTGIDQEKFEEINVEEINELPAKRRVELIADKFATVSQEYEALKSEDICIPSFDESDIPVVSTEDVAETMKMVNVNKSSVNGDIPAKIVKHFAEQIAVPLTDVLNS